MRAAGICSIQQGLTPEAAATVKQAISLARRRGHAQVTPLHVASAMLASSGGLFRRACLQAHSHPLQCKALELCFNVALNRLPASTTAHLLAAGPHHHHHHSSTYYPSLSNALVAAFKRAQAHQRRGSAENQQQPILAVKIEAEQLVISILDDPSVSRVMREAGFSSPQVKTRVEKTINHNNNNSNTTTNKHNNKNVATSSAALDVVRSNDYKPPHQMRMMSVPNFGHHQLVVPKSAPVDYYNVREEDVTAVLNSMMAGKSRRNIVVTGECVDTSEAVVRAAMDRGAAAAELRSARFASLPLFTLSSLSRAEIDRKILELRCNYLLTTKTSSSGFIVLYVGDIKWVADFWSSYGEQSRYLMNSSSLYYSSMEYVIMEIKRLVRDYSKQLVVVGIASFQAYMKCRAGHPSLEDLWELSSLTVPVGNGLSLCLNFDLQSPKGRENRPPMESSAAINFGEECRSGYGGKEPTKPNSSLPSWLQQCKEETAAGAAAANDENRVFTFFDIFEPAKNKRFAHRSSNNLWGSSSRNQSPDSSTSNCCTATKPDLLSNPNSSPNSASSSEVSDHGGDDDRSFKEFNGINLQILCRALEQKVPHQREIIAEIATAVLECRSGTKRQRSSRATERREETWLMFEGEDCRGKESVARELARVVYGSSQAGFVAIKNSGNDDLDLSEAYVEHLGLALNENPHRVFFIEEIDQTWSNAEKGMRKAIRTGRVMLSGGESVPLKDAIVILSCKSFDQYQSSSPCLSRKRKRGGESNGEDDHHGLILSLDLNMSIDDSSERGDDDDDQQGSNGIEQLVDVRVVFKVHGDQEL
ncbi:unnamed protein product [Linum tenue]|uniref:Clp R domain-containing protein n=1 Tax=Linum tenue TaxID=586396 RepID=A0AAV0JN39_9ROSI|nr:unnamed protein product [Linum tenue]